MEQGYRSSTCKDDINIRSSTSRQEAEAQQAFQLNNDDSLSSTSTIKHSRSNRCLSDSILHSYRRSQSDDTMANIASSSSTPSLYSPRQATRIGSNSSWGSSATFNIAQRSASMKEEIKSAISKINQCVNMIMGSSRQNSAGQESTIHLLCIQQTRQNMSKLAVFAQDDYYRIVAGNMGGIEVIIEAMNLISTDEILMATCNLALGILCEKSPHHQMKLMGGNGLASIITSIQNFPTSGYVCSTAIDALIQIAITNTQAISFLCQIKDIEDILNNTNQYLYPLSRQNKDILLREIQRNKLAN